MRILHIAPVCSDAPTGVSVYVVSLLNALAQRHEAQIGLLSHIPGTDDLKDLDKTIALLPALRGYHWNPWAINPKFLKLILDSFGRPDFVHFHSAYYPFHSALAFQLVEKRIPYFVSAHGGLQPYAQKRKAWKKMFGNHFFYNKFVKGALAIHALNDAEKKSVQKLFPGKQVFVVPNGVPGSMTSLIQSGRPFEKTGVLRVGFIGRMDMDHKGIDFLLKAVCKIQKEGFADRFRFIFAGPFDSRKDERLFQRLVRALPDRAAVEWKGVVRGVEKDGILNSFDIFVHTSRHEGMPGAVLEAMVRSIPCLVTPGTNMQSTIKDCDGGWNCEANPQAIAEALMRIDRDRWEIERKGRNAQEYVRRHWTWDTIAADYIRQVKALVS